MANTHAAFIFLIIPINFILAVVAQNVTVARNSPYICGNTGSYASNSLYKANLDELLSSLPTNINSSSGFYSGSTGQSITSTVNVMALCRGDIEFDACQACVQNTSNSLPSSCPNERTAIIWYDDCMLRYTDAVIAATLATSPYRWRWNGVQTLDGSEAAAVTSLLDDLRSRVVNSSRVRKVAAGTTAETANQTFYALVQCTPDLNPTDCDSCLISAVNHLQQNCSERTGCSIFLPSCVLRHETYPFFNESKVQSFETATPGLAPEPKRGFTPSPPPVPATGPGLTPAPVYTPPAPDIPQSPPKGGTSGVNKTRIILPAVVSIIVCLIIVVFVGICLRRRRKSKSHGTPKNEVKKVVNTPTPPQIFSNPRDGQGIIISEPPKNHSDPIELPKSETENPSAPIEQSPEEDVVKKENTNEPLPEQHESGAVSMINTSSSVENPSIPSGQLDRSFNTTESKQYEYRDLEAATSNFSVKNRLGQGAFGTVYKGVLQDKEIAVKKLSENSTQGDKEFKTEVLCLSQLRHKNLVSLYGFSTRGTEMLLVYEFVPNRSLNHHIFDPEEPLDWSRRFDIIKGIARGLLYLHEDSPTTIIHLDLKSSNILLDKKMNPKISDFGLARFFGADRTHGSTMNKNAGTSGYIPPEYTMQGQFSFKYDVYSFGVVLLEIISGRKWNHMTSGESPMDLISYALKNWRDGKKENIVDKFLRSSNSESMNDILKCIRLSFLCVEADSKQRPEISAVISMLGDLNRIPSEDPSDATYNRRLDTPNSPKVHKPSDGTAPK